MLVVCFIIVISFRDVELYTTEIKNVNDSMIVDLNTMALKIIENEYDRLYTPLDTYSGDLTGYVYNCPACTGRLACNSSLDLSKGRTTYNDKEYGEVNIVASSKNLSCGTIVAFESDRVSDKKTYAIVLDRGVRGNSLDLLVESNDIAYGTIGRSNITYDVIRKGYSNED